MEDIPELQADGSERGLIVYKGHTHSAQIGELGVFPPSVCLSVCQSVSVLICVCLPVNDVFSYTAAAVIVVIRSAWPIATIAN